MREAIQVLVGVLVLLLLTVSIAAAPFEVSYAEAQSVAKASHDGDLVLFLYDDSAACTDARTQLFGDEVLSTYIDEHFGAAEIPLQSELGQEVLRVHAGQGSAPRIIVVATRLNNLTIHVALVGEIDRVSFLAKLRAVKTSKTYEEYSAALTPRSN